MTVSLLTEPRNYRRNVIIIVKTNYENGNGGVSEKDIFVFAETSWQRFFSHQKVIGLHNVFR